jgi:hypothetical protein
MFDAPLSTILNNGLLGAMLVLALLVIWWQQRRYDAMTERRYQEAMSFKDSLAKVVAEQTETQRISAEKMASMADSMKTIAGAMYQSFYIGKGGRHDA